MFEEEYREKWASGREKFPRLITLVLPNDHLADESPATGYRSAEWNRQHRRRHKIPAELMRQLLAVLIHWFPRRKLAFAEDGGCGAHPLARFAHRQHLTLVSRFYADANVYTPPPNVVAGCMLLGTGGGQREVAVVSGTAYWYKGGDGLVPVRWVFVLGGGSALRNRDHAVWPRRLPCPAGPGYNDGHHPFCSARQPTAARAAMKSSASPRQFSHQAAHRSSRWRLHMGASLLCVCAAIVATAAAADWPQFRGPTGDGLAAQASPPVHWSEGENIRWKVALPGRGRSSPVLLGNRIWMTFAIERSVTRARIESDDSALAEHVSQGALCLDRDSGKCLWQVILHDVDKPAHVHWLNSWATPTPVVEPGRLYCDFGTYGTACLDSQTGKVLWRQQLPVDHQVGPGSSPILQQELLVLVRDGRDAQYVAALDGRTGQLAWKMDRPHLEATIGNLKKSFSTPLVIKAGGRTQIVVPGAEWVVSYDPRSGKELWRVRHGKGFSLASRPVFGHDLVYISTGAMKPQLWAIRADGQGDVSDTHVVWKVKSQVPLMSSPILVGQQIYMVSDTGVASCLDALTGEVHWQERLDGKYLASPICAANRLYFVNDEAKTTVLAVGTSCKRLAENSLSGTVIATPAAVDRSIFLRTDSHLYRIESDRFQ